MFGCRPRKNRASSDVYAAYTEREAQILTKVCAEHEISQQKKTSSNPFPRELVIGKSESEDLLLPTIKSHACRGNGLLKAS